MTITQKIHAITFVTQCHTCKSENLTLFTGARNGKDSAELHSMHWYTYFRCPSGHPVAVWSANITPETRTAMSQAPSS
jgi:hypothetical protein